MKAVAKEAEAAAKAEAEAADRLKTTKNKRFNRWRLIVSRHLLF